MIMEGVAPFPRMGSCIRASTRMRQGRQKQRTGSITITCPSVAVAEGYWILKKCVGFSKYVGACAGEWEGPRLQR